MPQGHVETSTNAAQGRQRAGRRPVVPRMAGRGNGYVQDNSGFNNHGFAPAGLVQGSDRGGGGGGGGEWRKMRWSGLRTLGSEEGTSGRVWEGVQSEE